MITYTYQCDDCSHHFEIKQRITDPALTECEKCKHHSLRRVVQPNPFILKKDGWPSNTNKGKYHE